LLIALSIVHGFKSTINEKIVGFAPHITVNSYTGDTISCGYPPGPHQRTAGVGRAQPVALGQVMVQSTRDVSGTVIKGVPENGDVTNLRTYVTRELMT
jgi:lipoprotein-releasing system permease protein